MVRRAPAVEEAPAHLQALPGAARSEGRRHRADRHARSLARAADDRGGQGRLRHLRPEADQRRRPRGPGDAGGGAQVQARRPGRHAAPQHAAPDHRARPHRPRRQARQDRAGRDLLLLRDAGDAEPARRDPAAQPRLRAVDRAGADAALQRAGPPAPLARLHGVRQRHRRRHVRAHARHGALDARPRHAQPRSPRRAASWSRRTAAPTSPTPRPRRSTSANCR